MGWMVMRQIRTHPGLKNGLATDSLTLWVWGNQHETVLYDLMATTGEVTPVMATGTFK
jgi:hypothetical protein